MSDKRQIVDENDALIGSKAKTEMDYAKDIYRVSTLWVMNQRGDILLAQRGLSADNSPGLWGPAVAGTVEEGETYEANIYKEAEEEIGLAGVEFIEGPKIRITSPRNYFCQFYSVVISQNDTEFILQKEEVESVRWFDVAELRKNINEQPGIFIPEMKSVINSFLPERSNV